MKFSVFFRENVPTFTKNNIRTCKNIFFFRKLRDCVMYKVQSWLVLIELISLCKFSAFDSALLAKLLHSKEITTFYPKYFWLKNSVKLTYTF